MWLWPSNQGRALAGLVTGGRGMSRCPMWTCFAGLWLRPSEITLQRPQPGSLSRTTVLHIFQGVAEWHRHRHTAGGDREARVSRRPGPQRQGDARVPVPSPGFLGRTRRAEPLGSRELEQRRKHLHSAREKGDPLRRAAGTGGCLPQPLGRCGEITSRPCRGIRQPPGPASPRRGKTLASVLIAPCWIQEVLWIVQQAYCH